VPDSGAVTVSLATAAFDTPRITDAKAEIIVARVDIVFSF
jgi:hypothetical protein